MKEVYIDSDLIVDFLTDREPFCEKSAKIMNLCIENQIKGFITPLIIANVFYVLRKKIDAQELKNKLKSLLSFLDVISMNKKIILTALNSDFSDFEDALQNFTVVQNSDVQIILTRNIKDYKNSTLTVYTPNDYLNLIDS